jgi:hypothetical protein
VLGVALMDLSFGQGGGSGPSTCVAVTEPITRYPSKRFALSCFYLRASGRGEQRAQVGMQAKQCKAEQRHADAAQQRL